MESELATSSEQEMSPEIKKCKEEKFDFCEWEECDQRYRNNILSTYYPNSYTTPNTVYSSPQTGLRYSIVEQESQTKPRMSFSISSILGTHEESEEQRFQAVAHPPRYRDSLLMRHNTFKDSLKHSRIKRHLLQEESAKEKQEKGNSIMQYSKQFNFFQSLNKICLRPVMHSV